VVTATVVREGRGDKIIVFKYHNKKRYRRTQGHRQDYTYLTVTDIQANGESLVSDEDRKRYEAQAHRAADRYDRKLLALLSGHEDEIEENQIEADDSAEDETEE